MMSVGVSYVSLLNVVAYHCGVPFVSYLWEIGQDGTLLAGVQDQMSYDTFQLNSVGTIGYNSHQ
uniref:Uncharacterized protein n=1 Tax=Oryza brachyantha TaxID=4533 RepID=J3ND90_ORYBR